MTSRFESDVRSPERDLVATTTYAPEHLATAFIGFVSPIARFFTGVSLSRYAEVILVDGPEPAAPTRHSMSSATQPVQSVVGLITWADLLRYPPDVAADTLARFMASDSALGAVRRVTLCLVPFASFIDAGSHLVQFACANAGRPSSSLGDAALYASLINRMTRAGYECDLVIAPMVLVDDADQASGYSCLLHKLLRVSRCLHDEVVTKVPNYFSRYPLQLQLDPNARFNVTTPADLSACLLGRVAHDPVPDSGQPFVCLESPLPSSTLAEALAPVWDMELRSNTDPGQFTALDRVFNELMWSDRDCGFQSLRYQPPTTATVPPTAERLSDVAARVALKPCESWECSFAPLRNRNIFAVEGLARKIQATGEIDTTAAIVGPQEPGYYVGGTGEAIVLLTPLGVSVGLYASFVAELLPHFKVLVWPTRRIPVPTQIEGIIQMVDAEGVDGFHLFAWCSSGVFSSMLIKENPSRVRSFTMLAAGLGDEPVTDALKKTFWLIEQLKKHPSQAERIQTWSKEAFKETSDGDLGKYAPALKVVQSPLQHHPVGFWPSQEEDLSRTQSFLNLFLGWEQDFAFGQDASRFRVELANYQGPVLAGLASHDHLTHYDGVLASYRKHRPWTLVTLLGGNHYTLLEHAPAWAELIGRFVRTGTVRHTPTTIGSNRLRIEYGPDESPSAWSSTT